MVLRSMKFFLYSTLLPSTLFHSSPSSSVPLHPSTVCHSILFHSTLVYSTSLPFNLFHLALLYYPLLQFIHTLCFLLTHMHISPEKSLCCCCICHTWVIYPALPVSPDNTRVSYDHHHLHYLVTLQEELLCDPLHPHHVQLQGLGGVGEVRAVHHALQHLQ